MFDYNILSNNTIKNNINIYSNKLSLIEILKKIYKGNNVIGVLVSKLLTLSNDK